VKASFDHIALLVEDVSATVNFYTTTFEDVEILYQDDSWAFISIDGLKLAFVIRGQHPPHLAMRIDDRQEFERQAENYNKPINRHRDRSESFYFKDPAGNVIEVMYYPPDYAL
jgi:catechol-2,3-dioxygenase